MSCSNDARTYLHGNKFQECPQWDITATRDYVQHHCVWYVCKDQHSYAARIFSWRNRACNEAHVICILHTAVRDTFNNPHNKRTQHVVVQGTKATRLVCLAPALVSIVDSDMPNLLRNKVKYASVDARVARHLDAPARTTSIHRSALYSV
jgi:hypothetical protein